MNFYFSMTFGIKNYASVLDNRILCPSSIEFLFQKILCTKIKQSKQKINSKIKHNQKNKKQLNKKTIRSEGIFFWKKWIWLFFFFFLVWQKYIISSLKENLQNAAIFLSPIIIVVWCHHTLRDLFWFDSFSEGAICLEQHKN